MKAFHVWVVDGWSELVFAASAGKAKAMFWREWRVELDGDWAGLRAKREPAFDGMRHIPCLADHTSEFRDFWGRWSDAEC